MSTLCDGRVVVVTGGGRGLGRSHALTFAQEGARVVVCDTGADVHGVGTSHDPADEVVAAIRDAGGEAIASYEDAADWDGAQRLIATAVDTFGGLDAVVNNAGILRDRMLINMTADEWDAVMYVHLRGTFAPSRWAATYWRERAKTGHGQDACIVNTSSPSGLYGNIGQTNYGAAKAGIAAFTITASRELARYGVRVNAIAPAARTRMSEGLPSLETFAPDDQSFDFLAVENVSPLVVWLCSTQATGVTGRVFNVWGGDVSVAEGWHAGPRNLADRRYETVELGAIIPELVNEAAPPADVWGQLPTEQDTLV